MKNSILATGVILFIISTFSYSQNTNLPVDDESGKIVYQDVIHVEGNKEQLFNRSISWINSFYKNPLNVTRERNPASGIVRGLHRFKIMNTDKDGNKTDAGIIQYKFKLQFKDGRYRYTLYDFILKKASAIPVEKWLNKDDPQYNPQWAEYLNQINGFAISWIKSLKEGMQPQTKKEEDDW